MPAFLCATSDENLLPLALGEDTPPDVEAHVADCPSCRTRLQQLKAERDTLRQAAQELKATTWAQPASSPNGEKLSAIGKYLVMGTLGQGAQAVVYRAFHPNLNRELAIKLSKKPLQEDEPERDLLVREGKLLAGVQHPNLVSVLDLDFYEDRPFVAYEYVRGRNLEQFAQDDKLAPRQAAALVAQVARALEAVHQQGIVHQDVKPRNILIDEAGRPRLLDFGLARHRCAWAGDDPQPAGGTVAFMSPEQARKEYDEVGPRSDIFSLGGVLYYLLTGKDPFSGEDRHEAQERARRCEFDRTALAGIPRRLQTICLRAMDADPARRYARASELAADLEAFVRRPAVIVRWAAAAALLAVIVAVAGFAANLWNAKPYERIASQPNTNPSKTDVSQNVVKPEPQKIGEPQMLIAAVDRREKGKHRLFRKPSEELSDLLPLQSADLVRFQCDVPKNLHPAMFIFTGRGELKSLGPISFSPEGKLTYPSERDHQYVELRGSPGTPGTHLILVCASKEAPPSLDEVRDIIKRESRPLPPMPPDAVIMMSQTQLLLGLKDKAGWIGMDPDKVRSYLGPARDGILSKVNRELNDIRDVLAVKYPFVAGTAYDLPKSERSAHQSRYKSNQKISAFLDHLKKDFKKKSSHGAGHHH